MAKKVPFAYKRTGEVREMELRYAKILQSLGHGTYLTRDMRPQPVAPQVKVEIETAAEAEPEKVAPKKRGRPAKNKE
jgi:hypothetical protein